MNSMRMVTGAGLLAVLLSSAGCRAEMSDARRAHILAGSHGWIDLTLKAAPKAVGFDAGKRCVVSFASNGERQLAEVADLARAEGGDQPYGYRFVVPSGALKTELTLDGCVPLPVVVTLPLALAKDHLARLVFDGSSLVLHSSAPYEPTSLEWVRGEIVKLHANNDASGAAVSRLTTIAIASLALNGLALLLFFFSRRKRA
jgi:hypothetical protein